MNHVSRVEMISPNCWSKPWTVDTISCRYMRFARSEEQILCGLICMSCHVMCFLDIFVHYYKILPGISGHEATGCSKVQPGTTFLSLGRHRCLAQEGSSPGRNMWFLYVSFVVMYCTMYTLFFSRN